MGQAGVEKHSMLTPTGTPGQWTGTCPHAKDGVLVRGGTFQGGQPHGACETTTRLRENFNSRIITIMPGSQTIELLCANNNGARWNYAASSGRNEMIAEAPEADVLVVGAGLGGHAAAAAVADTGNGLTSHTVFSPSAGSTSARSTGVVWFPTNRTYDELMEASGANETTEEHLRAYVELGPASLTYWKPKLNLTVYPSETFSAPDYTQYASGPKAGNSYQHAPCGSVNNTPCGALTLTYMQQALGVSVKDGYNVTNVEPTRSGFRVTHSALGVQRNATFKAVIFASGGSGRYNGFNPSRILASPENTGVHMHVAKELGLRLNPNRNLSWGLEFGQTKQNGEWPDIWNETWFSFGCAPEGVDNYKKCGDYNTRTLSWPDDTPRLSTILNVSQCSSESASYAFWKTVMSGYYKMDAEQYDQIICGTADTHRLATGMIDGKDGFLTDPATMESKDQPGMYAVGTTGSYGLGNTYFGPGATLGWALHSGRLAGNAAVAHVQEVNRRDAHDAAVTVRPSRKRPVLVQGFRIGSWLLLAAVLLHMPGKPAAWAHYVLAPAAVAVLLATAWRAQGQRKRDRMMLQIDSSKSKLHAGLGVAVAVLMTVQVGLGVAAFVLNRRKKRSAILSTEHRILGWTLLVLVAGLFWTSLETAPLYDDNRSKREAAGEARLFGAIVVASGVFALALAVANVWRLAAAGKAYERIWSQPPREFLVNLNGQ